MIISRETENLLQNSTPIVGRRKKQPSETRNKKELPQYDK